MTTFTIDTDNNITAYATAADATTEGGDATAFDSQAELAKAAADWPLNRLVEIWNSIPGQTAVKKFQDRKKATARIWAAIQPLAEAPVEPKTAAGKGGKTSPKPKRAEVIAMVKRWRTSRNILSTTPTPTRPSARGDFRTVRGSSPSTFVSWAQAPKGGRA